MNNPYHLRSPDEYIMHRGPMLLIDEILYADDKLIRTRSRINSDNIFFNATAGGVPSWVGLEYMAQSAAIWVGIDDERQNQKIQLGFLLGSRSYTATCPSFAIDTSLIMEVSTDFVDGRLIVFNGTIHSEDGNQLVEGNITAFRPEDVDLYLQGKN